MIGRGWAAKVRRIMEQNGLDRDGSGTENQVVLETLRGVAMREWARDMSRRVENRGDTQMSWRRVYRWRDSWGQGGVARATGYERLWVKARLETGNVIWENGGWGRGCIGAGDVGPGMRTSPIICLSVGSFGRGETEWQGRWGRYGGTRDGNNGLGWVRSYRWRNGWVKRGL